MDKEFFENIVTDVCDSFDTCRSSEKGNCPFYEEMKKVSKERDTAVEQLRGLCSACKHYTPYHNDGPCATCTHEVACFVPEKATDKWEWVGVKEE